MAPEQWDGLLALEHQIGTAKPLLLMPQQIWQIEACKSFI